MKFNRELLRPLIIIGAILVVLLLGFTIYRSVTFRMTGTTPGLSNFPAVQPNIVVKFNKDINDTTLDIDDPSKIILSKSTDGKKITLNLGKLFPNRRYTITIKHVEDQNGHELVDKKIEFVTKDIQYKDLSKQSQQALIAAQDKYDYNIYSMPFVNFDDLTNYGLTSDQEQLVKLALFDYSNSIKQKFTKDITITKGSITTGAFSPDSTAPRTVTFNVTANDVRYSMLVSYSDLSSANITIKDATGKLVFNNANVQGESDNIDNFEE